MRRAAAGLVLLGAVAVTCVFWRHVRNEFFVILGSRNEAGGWYGFHSGAGGAYWMALIPAIFLLYWHHMCHTTTCVRWGKHKVDGTPWCGRHHLQARRLLAATGSAHDLTMTSPGDALDAPASP